MIKPSFILTLLLLVAFVPIRTGIIWRTGSTIALVLGANWMHLRVQRTEKIQEAVYAHITGKSIKATQEDFPPVSLVESSREFTNNIRQYVPVEAITTGLKKIAEDTDRKEIDLKNSLSKIIDPSGSSKNNKKES